MPKKSVSFYQGNDDVLHLEIRELQAPLATAYDSDVITLSSRRSSTSSQDTCSSAVDDVLRVAAAAKALVLARSLSPFSLHGVQRLVISPTATKSNDDDEASFRSCEGSHAQPSCSPPLRRGRSTQANRIGGPSDQLQHTVRPSDGDAIQTYAAPHHETTMSALDLSIESAGKSMSAGKWQVTSFCSQGTFVEHRCTPSTGDGTPSRSSRQTSQARETSTEQYAVAVQVAKEQQHRTIKELLREGCQRMLVLDENDDDAM
jgi:hypothetical protein